MLSLGLKEANAKASIIVVSGLMSWPPIRVYVLRARWNRDPRRACQNGRVIQEHVKNCVAPRPQDFGAASDPNRRTANPNAAFVASPAKKRRVAWSPSARQMVDVHGLTSDQQRDRFYAPHLESGVRAKGQRPARHRGHTEVDVRHATPRSRDT